MVDTYPFIATALAKFFAYQLLFTHKVLFFPVCFWVVQSFVGLCKKFATSAKTIVVFAHAQTYSNFGGDSKSMMGLYYTKLDIVARRYCACVRSFFRYAIFE